VQKNPVIFIEAGHQLKKSNVPFVVLIFDAPAVIFFSS
jgi:hypothetical protein